MGRRRDAWDVPGRGELTRDGLLRAGMEQLLELGWAALTVRSVSARAGVSPSLLTYHFGGVGRFRRAVLAEAVLYMLQPLLHTMTTHRSLAAGVAAVLTQLAEEAAADRFLPVEDHDDLLGHGPPGPEHRRVLAEAVVGSVQDAVAREVVQESLGLARLHLLGWLEGVGVPPEHLDASAALLVALLDGVLLHHQIDPTLPVDRAAELVWSLAGHPPQSERSAGTTSVSKSSMPLVS